MRILVNVIGKILHFFIYGNYHNGICVLGTAYKADLCLSLEVFINV